MVFECHELVVKIIVVKRLLCFWVLQACLVYLEILVLAVLPLLIYVFLIEVVGLWRDKRAGQFALLELFERKITQPNMILYFFDAVGSQPVLRFPLDHPVYKVGGSCAPAFWNLVLSDLDLLLENMVTNFLP